jgi:predicted nucleotidyltransferase
MTADVLNSYCNDILRLAAHHGARHVRVFGSAARGGAGPTRDIDLLVRMDRGRSLLDLTKLSQELAPSRAEDPS